MARGCCVRAPGAEDARTFQSPATDPLKNTEFPQEVLSWGLNGTVLRSLTAIQEKLN